MKKSEVLRNEASVMLAGMFEKLSNELDYGECVETADKITRKMLEASNAYWEETYVYE